MRYRHADSDLVRAARQQDFLRAAKDQVEHERADRRPRASWPRRSSPPPQTDKNLRSTARLPAPAQAGARVRRPARPRASVPGDVRQGASQGEQEIDFVTAAPVEVAEAVEALPAGRTREDRGAARRSSDRSQAAAARSWSTRGRGMRAARARSASGAGFAVRLSGLPTPDGRVSEARRADAAHVRAARPRRHAHRAYRIVRDESLEGGQYYGVQGTTWRDPPLLATAQRGPAGARAAPTSCSATAAACASSPGARESAAYWISNTLNLTLTTTRCSRSRASLTSR